MNMTRPERNPMRSCVKFNTSNRKVSGNAELSSGLVVHLRRQASGLSRDNCTIAQVSKLAVSLLLTHTDSAAQIGCAFVKVEICSVPFVT